LEFTKETTETEKSSVKTKNDTEGVGKEHPEKEANYTKWKY
jgi:hypothetical protein